MMGSVALFVAALLAIRVAALPHNLVGKLWLGVCSVGLIAAFVHAAWWTDHPHGNPDDIFALWQVSPLLGIVQIALLFAIPITLIRALRSPASAAPGDDPAAPRARISFSSVQEGTGLPVPRPVPLSATVGTPGVSG